jgi:putative glycosyltransferase (TIGR04348 family)
VALHAWRSHEVVERFRQLHPDTPLIVALTGTDIYDHQQRFPEQTWRSMDLADCLIGLNQRVACDIPERYGEKLVTVLQSADQPSEATASDSGFFTVCVIGHLRDEKDSLRAAISSRLLPADSTIKVVNAGKPHSSDWETRTLEEQALNPHFEWLGEIDKPAIQALMQRCQLMVISSVMEGGANVVSEACRIGLPILASDISGNIGLLGEDYPGYFRTGNEEDLVRLMMKAEASPDFVIELTKWVTQLAEKFTPESEQASLAAAIEMALAQRERFSQ